MFTQVTVTGTFKDGSGNVQKGTVTAVLTTAMTNAGVEVSLNPTMQVTIDINGQVSIPLYATNDSGTTPTGVMYTFYIQIINDPVKIIGPTVLPNSQPIIDLSSLPWTGSILPVLVDLTQHAADQRYLVPLEYSGSAYPARPLDVITAFYIGAVQPPDIQDGDIWMQT
jgi:hypothetical protein